MLTSLRSQKFIRNPQISISPRQIFTRKPTNEIAVSTKIDTNTEVGFEWLFKLLNEHGISVIESIFTNLGFTYRVLKNEVLANKDKLMAELKDTDTKDAVLFVLGNLVFRVPIGIGQAIIWILK